MEKMLKKYREARSVLMGYKLRCPEEEKAIVGSMISDLQLSIEWMQTGLPPGRRRGIHRLSYQQRTSYLDPLYLQSYAQPAACGSPTTLSDSERFRIDEALHGLSERERQAYMLHRGLCFSIGQTAQEMNVTRGAVQTLLKRAEEKIKKNKEENLFLAIS